MPTARRRQPKAQAAGNGAVTGYEAQLWRMADALRGSMDAAEYKHVVLGLIFLKYISDAFEEMHARLEDEVDDGADPEDPDEYRAQGVFWVPPEARWPRLQAQARQPAIGRLVDCMVALPGQLFYSTQIPACLWFLARNRTGGDHRDRMGEVLFIDARRMGRMVDRTHRELTDDKVARIADAYHAWRGEEAAGAYADVPGFCRSAPLEEVRKHGHVLTPGRYVGAEAQEEDGEPFEEKMARLAAQWREQQAEAQRLDAEIEANLARLGFGE